MWLHVGLRMPIALACGQVLESHAGLDITDVFNGSHGSHSHSEAAAGLLHRYVVGSVANSEAGPASDGVDEWPEIDISRPLALQVCKHGGGGGGGWVGCTSGPAAVRGCWRAVTRTLGCTAVPPHLSRSALLDRRVLLSAMGQR